MQTIRRHFLVVLLTVAFYSQVTAQQSQNSLQTVLEKDSLFWLAYNTCDTSQIGGFYADDVEFYHDKNGFSKGKDKIVSTFKRNLCTDDFRLRREALDSTVKVFVLKNQDIVYGAIISGEHYFYVAQKGKKERLDGWAKFTHTWILENNTWKMTRLLSYDHKPAPYINKRKLADVSTTVLDTYAGSYKSSVVGTIVVKRSNRNLLQIIGGKEFAIYPETPTLFFSKERDLTFEFSIQNTTKKMIVRENGEVVDEMMLVK